MEAVVSEDYCSDQIIRQMTFQQRADFEDIVQNCKNSHELDMIRIAEKIASGQYLFYSGDNLEYIGHELVEQRMCCLPDWLENYIAYTAYAKDTMHDNPNFLVTTTGVYQLL